MDVSHSCDPNEGFAEVLAQLGVHPATVNLALLPPALCRHRLLDLAPAPVAENVVGRCQTCQLDIILYHGQYAHDVPINPVDTRPARWLFAARHKPRP